jgi:hypothetical protein
MIPSSTPTPSPNNTSLSIIDDDMSVGIDFEGSSG